MEGVCCAGGQHASSSGQQLFDAAAPAAPAVDDDSGTMRALGTQGAWQAEHSQSQLNRSVLAVGRGRGGGAQQAMRRVADGRTASDGNEAASAVGVQWCTDVVLRSGECGVSEWITAVLLLPYDALSARAEIDWDEAETKERTGREPDKRKATRTASAAKQRRNERPTRQRKLHHKTAHSARTEQRRSSRNETQADLNNIYHQREGVRGGSTVTSASQELRRVSPLRAPNDGR